MASGGYHSNKQAKSETKRRSNWQRSVSSDRDDAQSLNSFPSDIRINNWDLSDLRPTNLTGDSKRRKKSKGNPEREREQSLSMDSPPHGDGKQHTPSTYPRTKLTPSTPTSQRVALENLKQHMTFSDLEDQVSTDGERNNERQFSQSRRRLQNASFNRTESDTDGKGARERRVNRNNNMDYSANRESGVSPDRNEIVARLMQIRDFMKQAKSMMEGMEKLGDRKKAEDVEKVRRLIRNLQEQEQGYRGLLQNSRAQRDGENDDVEEEREDTAVKMESKEDSDDSSVDLEFQNSETSENSEGSRPRIESKLGLGSDDEEDAFAEALRGAVGSTVENSNSNRTMEAVENALEQQLLTLPGVPMQETEEGASGATAVDDGEGLSAHHQELLNILREKQQQLQSLMSRQEELNLKRRETEKKLLDAQARDNKARAALALVSTNKQIVQKQLMAEQAQSLDLMAAIASRGGMAQEEDELEDNEEEEEEEEEQKGAVGGDSGVLKSNIVGYPESDDEDNSNVREVEGASLPNELLELKRQLNFLRNEFSRSDEGQKNMEVESQALTEDRQQLQNKLLELQTKKSRMDKLLHELQMLHEQPLANPRNNESQPLLSGSSQALLTNIPSSGAQPKQRAQQAQLPTPPPLPPLPSFPNMAASSSLPASLQTRMNDVATAAPSALESAMATFSELASADGENNMDPQMYSEVTEKLRRLKEVRGQLDQLRGLVQYYQTQKDDMEARDGDDQSSLPGFSDSGERALSNTQAGSDLRGSRSSLQQRQPQQQLDLLLLQQQQQQQQQHQQQQKQQKRWAKEEENASAAVAAASSLQNMAQLLNLAGADQGDEHSDEDNASVSQSDSQWSHLGPWDDDPEIQEKVKKLKAAKEKLRQLQDLVAFVQQSPDAARALPENLGDLAASVAEEAVSQATQTDEPNVSVSEGEVPIDAQRREEMDAIDGLENPRAELERLRKERTRLLELQSQLKQMHDIVGGNSGDQDERSEQSRDMGKSGQEQAPNATVVTFASNDELYSKMRRQRILREELRSKKKELEAIMKKDRNKRQYSRNQDNQSDTVSLNTDTFGIPASVDATMATWGGSTVDNLENITEDEDGQERNDRVNGDEDGVDDGYPSDGIVQVEEEEEENDSDNGTYTIEADARHRKSLRKGASMGIGARPKTSRGRQTFPQPSYNDRNTKKPQRKESNRKSQRRNREAKLRQENYRSAEEIMQDDEVKGKSGEWFRVVEDRLSNLSGSVEALLRKSESENRQLSVSLSQENAPQGGSLLNPVQEQMLQLQNQSMMLSFGQLVQSLSRQQVDMQQLQQQMQMLQLQVQEYQGDHSFQNLTPGAGPVLRPALSTTALNNSNYNLQAATTVGAQSISLSRHQTSLNNTAPAGFLSSHSPGLRGPNPSSGHGLSSSNLSLGGQGPGLSSLAHLGTGLSVNTGSHSSLPQQSTGSGFVFNPLGQSTLVSMPQQSNVHLSHGGSSASTMTRDFSQFVNTLTPNSASQADSLAQFSNLFGSSSQQQQPQGMGSGFPSFFSQNVNDDGNDEDGDQELDESPVPRMSSYLKPELQKQGKRKQGSRVKKSESDPTSGLRMSTPKVENSLSRSREALASRKRLSQREGGVSYRSGTSSGGADAAAYASLIAGAEGDAGSSFSSIQSIKDEHSRQRNEQTSAKSIDLPDDNNTLFETLRETIYSEVASLISQNQSRPQFLLELFREMRQVDSDFMRQRTLNSLQDVINTTLKSGSASSSNAPAWLKAANTADTANSEQTPSESVTSEDDEELQVTRLQEQITQAERSLLGRLSRDTGPLRNFPFDYAEAADHPSSLSTPTNGTEDSPFFQDALGETVIEFQSLRLKEAERLQSSQGRGGGGRKEGSKRQGPQAEGGRRTQSRWGESGFLSSHQLLTDIKRRGREDRRGREELGATAAAGKLLLDSQTSEVASSSAMDQASESSFSDVPYPRIDMKELDRQIKDIMMETIPVVKLHMEDVCSPQLLAYIKRLVLSLTAQLGNQEFARFFQRQLASILQDTLNKYEGRKMRECGEDLLVEMSDVLFNELAFFKLMQDLDDPNVAGKIRAAEWPSQMSQEREDEGLDYNADSSSTEEDGDDEDENCDRNRDGTDNAAPGMDKAQQGFRISEAEQDVLGRERDDEMANEVCIRDAEEKDDNDPEQSYKIELAPSETKPFTRIGSDEDDSDGDEEQSMEDPSETAVSRDSMLENGQTFAPNNNNNSAAQHSVRPETEGAQGSAVDSVTLRSNGAEKQDQEKPVAAVATAVSGNVGSSSSPGSKMVTTAAARGEVDGTTSTAQMNGSINGRNNSEDDELTVDDLPERLTVPPASTSAAAVTNVSASSTSTTSTASAANSTANNTPELRWKMEEEQHSVSGLEAVLASLEGFQELAGDPQALIDPDSFIS
ncbi:pericentriolar material 1 protein isoform X2 [Aplysia californica]|uniref:Pericentriolar material 1 protein isoform X2 n=1 Tax=Aplysia californica TaxID=6500 RepID=A0ABM0JDH2_APLCA|nr:pericentriolar material 1 protein isoform X2 [Aplysia californica]